MKKDISPEQNAINLIGATGRNNGDDNLFVAMMEQRIYEKTFAYKLQLVAPSFPIIIIFVIYMIQQFRRERVKTI